MKMSRISLLILLLVMPILYSCDKKQISKPVISSENKDVTALSYVKSVMLYDTIQKYPLDTILAAIKEVNDVISIIEPRDAGYSVWKVQSDSIPDFRYLIEGKWPDQASFDLIHKNPEFRKALDKNVHIFTETRKWDLYRRYQRIHSD